MKQILHRVISLICTPNNSNHVRSQYIRPGKQVDLFVYCICISRCIIMWHSPVSSTLFHLRVWIIGQPRNMILRNTRATIVLGGSQFTLCIPLSKREAKIKNQAGFFVFDKFTLQVNLGDESGGV